MNLSQLVSAGIGVSVIGSTLILAYQWSRDQDQTSHIYEGQIHRTPNLRWLKGCRRPKMWIYVPSKQHNEFAAFHFLTLQSILKHCHRSFLICLVDDHSFAELLEDEHLQNFPGMMEPEQSFFRHLLMARLVYRYGGMVCPISLICFRDLSEFLSSQMVVSEGWIGDLKESRVETVDWDSSTGVAPISDNIGPVMTLWSAPKECEQLKDYIEMLKRWYVRQRPLLVPLDFRMAQYQWLRQQRVPQIPGTMIGTLDEDRNLVDLSMLFTTQQLYLAPDAAGVLIPTHRIRLSRTYSEFCHMLPSDVLLQTNRIAHLLIRALNGTWNSSLTTFCYLYFGSETLEESWD